MKAVLISNSSFMFLLHIYFISKVVLCISSGGTFHKWEGFCYNFLIRYQFSHLIISKSKTGGCEDAKMLRCRGGFKDLQTRRQKDVKMPCCEDARLITCPPSSTVLYFNAFMFNLFSKVAMFLVSANQARICYVTAQITWFVVVLHCNVCFSLYTNMIFVLIDISTFCQQK